MEFKIKKDQTQNHFIWEVYSLGYKTGLITRDEAGNICNEQLGLDFDESAFRKRYEAFEKMWEEVKHEYLIDDDSDLELRLKKIEEKEDELYKVKVRAYDALREKRKVLRDEARIEHLIEFMKDAINNLPEIKFKEYSFADSKDKGAILCLSDWHVGMEIDNYWTKYNKEIFTKYLEDIIDKTISYCKKFEINKLYVANVNDLISGGLHITARVEEEMDSMEQTMFVAEALSKMFEKFNQNGLTLVYSGVTDNHSRTRPFKEAIEKENLTKLIDFYLKARVGSFVEFIDNIDEGISVFEVSNNNVYTIHGHNDSITSVVQDMAIGTGKVPDIVIMGHYHGKQSKNIHDSKVIVNGNLVGVDSYAKKKRLFSKPSQTLVIINGGDILDIELKV